MSDRVVKAIQAREAVSRGETESGSYRDLQATAKELGIPANQTADELKSAIEEAATSGAEG